jgi:hypothetical protein
VASEKNDIIVGSNLLDVVRPIHEGGTPTKFPVYDDAFSLICFTPEGPNLHYFCGSLYLRKRNIETSIFDLVFAHTFSYVPHYNRKQLVVLTVKGYQQMKITNIPC